MTNILKNCWEITRCGREKNGARADELGECTASKEGLGHSCWAFVGASVCRVTAPKDSLRNDNGCSTCDVYRRYFRTLDTAPNGIAEFFPREEEQYTNMLLARLKL